jgi:uncharacterized protein
MTNMDEGIPRFGALDDEAARALLARCRVGRLAYLHEGRVDIAPIHYVLDGDWIVGRTSVGSKIDALMHAPWVAFEVDEVDGPFDWRSVVVHGGVYFPDPLGGTRDQEAYERAVDVLRTIAPGTLTPEDPTPHRSIVFRIHIDHIEGRMATTRAGA